MIRTVGYAPGKSVDVHVPEGVTGAPVVLPWHGSGPDERDALAPLAGELAARGVLSVVPDWQSDDAAVGADRLVASIAFVRDGSGSFGDVFAGAGADAGRRAELVHGTADRLVPVERSAGAAERLVRPGWTARLRRVRTDHAGVIGTVYDRNRRRCVPTGDPVRVEVRTRVADLVAATARRP